MRFVWTRWNRAHVGRHMSCVDAEAVFLAPDFDRSVVRVDPITAQGYGTVNGVTYFLVFQFTTIETPVAILIITCYPKDKP